jgi:hypothetical protein
MDIVEKSVISKTSIDALTKAIGNSIKYLGFEYNMGLHSSPDMIVAYSQNVIVNFGDTEIEFYNHYHDGPYLTPTHELHCFQRNVGNRPMRFMYSDHRIMEKIVNIEIWGQKDEPHFWDYDKIELYKRKGVIASDVNQVNHLISSQHILKITLQNDVKIITYSENKNSLSTEVFFNKEALPNLIQGNHLWFTLE